MLDCFVVAFYFHFSRTVLEIIRLAMTVIEIRDRIYSSMKMGLEK